MKLIAILNIFGMCLALSIGDDETLRFKIEMVQPTRF